MACVGCARTGGEVFQPTLNTALRVTADDAVGQTFRPAGDVVTGIDVHTAAYDLLPDADGALTVTLRERVGGPALAVATVPGRAVGEAVWAEATFDPPVAVDTPTVAFDVTWDGRTPLALWANVPPEDVDARVRLVNDPYPGGELLVDDGRAAGDLAFRVRGGGGSGAALAQLGEVVASTGNRLADRPQFALVWLALLGGAVALAVTGLRGSRPSGAPRRR